MASYETMQLIINELMINPNLSGRQLGKRLGMSHTTIENYLNRVKLSGKIVKELYAMPPGDLKATLQLTGERFTEPEDYLAVVKYMHPPRSYGNNGTHNITEAYTNLYLMKYFPEHIAQHEELLKAQAKNEAYEKMLADAQERSDVAKELAAVKKLLQQEKGVIE